MSDDQQSSEDQVSRAQMRKKSQVTMPREVREALHLSEGDEVEFRVRPDGEVTLRGMTSIPTDQKWFWTPEWQEGEREASAEIAAGKTTTYDSTDEFVAMLEELEADA